MGENSIDIFKRRGKFRIMDQLIRENPQAVQKVFAKCIPFRAGMMWEGYLEYAAISQHFDELEDGTEPPLYIVKVTTVYDGSHNPIDYVVEFVRVNA